MPRDFKLLSFLISTSFIINFLTLSVSLGFFPALYKNSMIKWLVEFNVPISIINFFFQKY